MTRGERNNNPGNIREYANDPHWVGERMTDDDPEFEEFITPEDGIRALAKTLLAYQRKHGLRTVREMISRWAPANENDTLAYINAVARDAIVAPDADINLEDQALLCRIVRAVIRHENGRVIYSDAQIATGVGRA
jgi:hypothetical protein